MRYLFAICLASLLGAGSIGAAAKDQPALIALSEKDRLLSAERTVLVELRQNEIAATVDVGRVAPGNGGGGLLGAIFIDDQDERRDILTGTAQQRAEATIAPLREVLADLEISPLALATTQSALMQLDWFGAQSVLLSTPSSGPKRADFIDAATSPQFALISYSYSSSPDFTQIRAVAEITIGRKTPGKKAPPGAFEVLSRQRISSVAELRQRSYNVSENVTAWSEDDGKLAREALAGAFERLKRLIPLALALDPAEMKSFTAKTAQKTFAAGFYGPPVQLGQAMPGDAIIWDNGLIDVFGAGGSE